MIQSVNFYELLEPERKFPKSLVYIWLAWALVLMVYVGWSIYLLTERWALEDRNSQLRLDNQGLQQRLQAESAATADAEVLAMEQRLADLQRREARQQDLLEHLRDPALSNVDGFSGVLAGLARQHRGGVAIESLQVTRQGAVFGMKGKVRQATDLPAYIVRLGDEDAFEDMSFEKITLAAADDPTDTALSFTLQSWSGQ